MYKQLSYLVFLLTASISINGFANIAPVSLELEPGVPVTIANPYGQTVTIQCEMHLASNTTHTVSIKALKGSGKINGTSLSQGQTLILTLHHLQVIPLTADKAAVAQFTNLSRFSMKTICS